jgi:hypothetical protein
MNDQQLTKLLEQAEKAIADHEGFRAVPGLLGEAKFEFSSFGWSVKINVKGAKRRTASEIHGSGDTPEKAVADLIAGLDLWYKAISV